MLRRARLACRLSLVAVLIVLAACGGPPAQTAQTDSFMLTLRMAGSSVGEYTATLDVVDRSGQPVAADSVVLAPVMRDMGMASPEVTMQPDGAGRYTATGPFFSMLGIWDLSVRVTAGGKEETASFAIPVQ